MRLIEPIDRIELRKTIQNWIEAHADVDDYDSVGLLEDVLWEIDAQTMLTHPNEWISVNCTQLYVTTSDHTEPLKGD